MTPREDLGDLDFSALREAPVPSLSQSVLDAVGEAPAAVRPIWPTWARVALAAGAGGGISLLALAMTTTRGAPTWLGISWVAVALAWLGVTVGLTWMALSEARPEVSETSRGRVITVAGVALLFLVYSLVEDLADGGGLHLPGGGEIIEGAKTCLAMGSIIELGPVLLIFLLLSRGATFHPVRAGALGGIAAAGWSVLVLGLHCPSASVLHVVPFHLGVALVWGLLGAGTGLFLRRRQERRVRP